MPKCSRCGRSFESKLAGATMCYSCYEKHKEDKFYKYGKASCKGCGATVSADRTYCWPCYQKHVLKK